MSQQTSIPTVYFVCDLYMEKSLKGIADDGLDQLKKY